MKRVIQFAVVGLCLNGLAFAADSSKPTSTTGTSQRSGPGTTGNSGTTNNQGAPTNTNSRGAETIGNNSNRIDSNSPTKNTDIRDGSIAPSGAGTTDTGSRGATGNTQIKGTVESVDQNGNRVRVRDSQGNIREYTTNDKTEFMNSEKKAKFSDLKSGDPVTLDFNNENQNVQKFNIDRRKQTLKK